MLSYPVIRTNDATVEKQIITYLKLPDVFSNNLIVDQSGDNIYVLDKSNGIFAVLRSHTDTNKYLVDCAFKLEDKHVLESVIYSRR